MKKLILAIYLFSLAGLVTSSCDCCDQCGTQEEQQEEVALSGDCPAIKYVSGGLSGSGFASRYWDCCKPSCSWTSNAGAGNEARQCTSSMSLITDYNAVSKCDGGPATTCLSQIPFTIDGCDNIGFAFGAVPGAGPNVCGRCFLLEFTGTGKYEKIKNKFKEIKKVIGETSLTKIIHKKTNTIGSTNIISNFLCNNFYNYNNLIQNTNQNIYNNINNSNSTRNNTSTITNKELKKASSINNLINNVGNKKKIINAMQRIKFIPVSYYSKTIKEMIKSKNNIFVLLVYKDQNQRYVFRGLYEIFEKDPKIAYKLFAPNNGQNIINVNNINYFYNYSLSRGDFIRYKFIEEKNKQFNEDTIIIF